MNTDLRWRGPQDLDAFTPMQIAHHPHLSHGEKLELLTDLKAAATGIAESDDFGFSKDEIEEAISDVRGMAYISPVQGRA